MTCKNIVILAKYAFFDIVLKIDENIVLKIDEKKNTTQAFHSLIQLISPKTSLSGNVYIIFTCNWLRWNSWYEPRLFLFLTCTNFIYINAHGSIRGCTLCVKSTCLFFILMKKIFFLHNVFLIKLRKYLSIWPKTFTKVEVLIRLRKFLLGTIKVALFN